MALQNKFSVLTVKSINKLMEQLWVHHQALAQLMHKQIWFNHCPENFKLVYYRKYVDDIFGLFRSLDHLEKFKNYLNSKHKNIKLTYEKESSIQCLFLIFYYQDQRTVLKHLFTTNQLLVGYILTSTVSFTTNIKLV